MKIRIKLNDVEILYEQESENTKCAAATTKEGYSSTAMQSQLIKTIKEIAEVAEKLNKAAYK